MPKEQRVTRKKPHRASPYRRGRETKEWEDARCPICLEHPHNAVLLNCSSHHKGCRPYICNTSQRHSNCLDHLCNSTGPSETPQPVCPLCRGGVAGWVVVEGSRGFMDAKARSCACHGCGFVGSYQELRRHARAEHPRARPSRVDEGRKVDWMRLQEEWEMEDLMRMQEEEWGMEEALDGDDLSDSDSEIQTSCDELATLRERYDGLQSMARSMRRQPRFSRN